MRFEIEMQFRFEPVDWYPWGEEAFAEARRRDSLFVVVVVMMGKCFSYHSLRPCSQIVLKSQRLR
ncbi:DUF255 family protein [Medicago truncatula]|uniref:DUF255 family protein n=1 Tax=Medicago truncatula TaxID=3880 RepID=A0A072V5Y2_MEDTR|nr:DUF255 family protein [Medicago truncatula]